MKILIVDDEKSIRFALKDIIEFEGHEVSLAADGKEGLEMALANSYDVIFSDIKMPVMDGVEMLEKMAFPPLFCEVRVIWLDISASTALPTLVQISV